MGSCKASFRGGEIMKKIEIGDNLSSVIVAVCFFILLIVIAFTK